MQPLLSTSRRGWFGLGGRARGSVSPMSLDTLDLDAVAEREAFSGVVGVNVPGKPRFARAFGLADRPHGIPNEVGTRFGVASGTKGLTALCVMSLVEDGVIVLETTARSLLGDDLPLIADDVTVEQLLAHRSGIGDYLDEETDLDLGSILLTVPAYELEATEDYLAVLDGFPTKFLPGERFSYSNSGYVVLALIAERAGGATFADLVRDRVCEPAGMRDTAFLRSDELPGGTAVGYVLVDRSWRTNVFHLPVRGSGDGGIYTTLADVEALWGALFAGRVVSTATLAEMLRPRSEVPSAGSRYGLGFWLHGSTDAVSLEGCDAGASFRSVHDPGTGITHTVLSNSADGAWPITRVLDERLGVWPS